MQTSSKIGSLVCSNSKRDLSDEHKGLREQLGSSTLVLGSIPSVESKQFMTIKHEDTKSLSPLVDMSRDSPIKDRAGG